jgi:hypothetical protein
VPSPPSADFKVTFTAFFHDPLSPPALAIKVQNHCPEMTGFRASVTNDN